MNQEDERKSAHDTHMITDRITKLKETIKKCQEELDRIEDFS